MDWKNKIAIITGGSSGIGLGLAKGLVRVGTSVAILARDRDRLENARKEIEGFALNDSVFIDVLPADVTDDGHVSKTIEEFIKKRGVPYFLFNCAGAAYPKYIHEYTISDFESAIKLDYLGTVIPTMALLPFWMEKGAGHVINISSIAGFLGLIGYGTYTPAKFAIIGFSEVLRHEMKPRGIRVSVVCPPDVDTPGFKRENETKPEECKIISARGKLLQPDEVARKILKDVKKNKFYILPGEAGTIFKLKGIFPNLVLSIIDGDLKKALKKLGKEIPG
ncbi:MAG: SDR family oxidoreductase [Promethearchaeota archaeon]